MLGPLKRKTIVLYVLYSIVRVCLTLEQREVRARRLLDHGLAAEAAGLQCFKVRKCVAVRRVAWSAAVGNARDVKVGIIAGGLARKQHGTNTNECVSRPSCFSSAV